MQAVFDLPIGSKPTLMQFAGGRNYMMRSEKRRSSNVPSGSSGNRPRRRPRRRRAGFFYKLFTILLLVVLWPVGLLLLWRRKLRWGVGTKLLASVVTLITWIILIGFALTVQTDNPKYTAVQDSINSFLDEAADALVETGGVVADKAVEIGGAVADFGDALWKRGSVLLADGIDFGVDLADSIKSDIKGMLRSDVTEPTETPEITDAPTDAPTAAPTQKPTEEKSIPIDVPDGFTVLQAFFCNCNADSKIEELEELAQQCGLYTYRFSNRSDFLELEISAEPYSEHRQFGNV